MRYWVRSRFEPFSQYVTRFFLMTSPCLCELDVAAPLLPSFPQFLPLQCMVESKVLLQRVQRYTLSLRRFWHQDSMSKS